MSNEYQVLSERIYSDFPIFGSCIRQRAAVFLSKDKSPQAVKILAEAVVRSSDRKVITIALEALRNLRDRDSVNAFCQVWAELRHKDLTTILKNRRYVSTEPKFLVLSALKVGALDLVKKGDIKVLDPLLAAISDKNTQIASAASVCLVELQDRKVIDALCKRWIENPSSQLQNVIQKGNYEPEDASSKALFYFLLGEWQKYEDLDFDQSLLAKAYQLANKQVKERVSKQAGTAGRVEFIKVLTSSKHDFDVEQMTDQDWESLSNILEAQPDRKTIWKFLYNAPVIWSKRLLDNLTKSSCKWFGKDEEVTVNTLLTLSENSKEEDFTSIPYVLMEYPKSIASLETDSNEDFDFEQWKLYFSPDSRILFGLKRFSSRGIKLWSLPDGKLLNILENTYDFTLVVSPDSKILVSTGGERESNEINLWSLPSGNHIRTLKVKMPHYIKPNAKGLISLAITPDGKMLVSRCWSIDPKWYPDNIRKLGESTSSSSKIKYQEKTELTKRILKENTIDLWSLPSGDYIRSIPSPTNDNYTQLNEPTIYNTFYNTFREDYKALGRNNKIILGDGRFNNLLLSEDYKALGRNNKIISHDGRILVSATKQGIELWSLPDDSLLRTLIFDDDVDDVIWLQISHDNRILISLTKKRFRSIYYPSLEIRNLSNGNLLKEMRFWISSSSHKKWKIQISPDSNILVVTDSYRICLYSLNQRNINIPVSKFTAHDIAEISSKIKDPTIQESFRNALKFTLALIRLRQEFDIDIEDSSNDIPSSEYDIEIE